MLPFRRQLFLLSFLFIIFTFLSDSQDFTFTLGPLKISSETHPLFILGSGIAFIQGIFIWILTVKGNKMFPETIGFIHFSASFLSLFGLEFLAKRMPSSLFLTTEEAGWLPFYNGAFLFVCLLYISGLILFVSVYFLLLIKKEVE
jgi:hypothetical protein